LARDTGRSPAAAEPRSRLALDRVWRDFQDLFGIVWARRVQERFNDDARRQRLAVRLGMHGLEDAKGTFRRQDLIRHLSPPPKHRSAGCCRNSSIPPGSMPGDFKTNLTADDADTRG